MAIKVHGPVFSPDVRRVIAALKEKELDFELVHVDLQNGEHEGEPFISQNPFGQVPAFEDEDHKFFDSRASTKHVAQEYADKGNQLLPKVPLPNRLLGNHRLHNHTFTRYKKELATVLKWTEVEAQKFDPIGSKLRYEMLSKPIATDDAVVAENEEKLGKLLDVYESRLKDSKYLGGESFTLADLHHAPSLHYLTGSKVKSLFDARPHVSAWCADILARPAWCKTLELSKQ